jgi:predicted amino acid-binding ACT domain protein
VLHAGIDRGPIRILELLGVDRHGLLADITALLQHHGCEAWSASIWTNSNRATFVLGVNDARFPLSDVGNWKRLRAELHTVMGGHNAHAVVELVSVVRCPRFPAAASAAAPSAGGVATGGPPHQRPAASHSTAKSSAL